MIRRIAVALLALPLVSTAQVRVQLDRQLEDLLTDFDRLYQQEEYEESLEYAEQAYALGLEAFPESSEKLAEITYMYGDTLSRIYGKRGESKPFLSTALERYESLWGKKSAKLIPILISFGRGQAIIDEDTARTHLKRATQISKSEFGKRSIEYADTSFQVGEIMFWLMGSSNVKNYFERAQKIYMRNPDENSAKLGDALFFLGEVSARNYRWSSAEKYYLASIDYLDPEKKDQNRSHLVVRVLLSNLYRMQGKPEMAAEHDLAISQLSAFSGEDETFPLYRSAPRYPRSAYEEGISGYVDLIFTVDTQGFVKNQELEQFTGSEDFVAAAIETTNSWRYAPRFEDGKAVESHAVKARIRFEIYGDDPFPASSFEDLGWKDPFLEPGQPQRDP